MYVYMHYAVSYNFSVTADLVVAVAGVVVVATFVGNIGFCKPLSAVQPHVDTVTILPTDMQVDMSIILLSLLLFILSFCWCYYYSCSNQLTC